MSIDKNELKYMMTELKKVLASKPELEALRDVINEDLSSFKDGLNEDISTLKEDFNEDISTLKEDFNEDLSNLRDDFNEDLSNLRDVVNEDLLEFDPNITYMGDVEPESNNVIWFDTGKSATNEITFDNPIISELFACIRTLQDQVQQLQADVEYLKIYGGGGGSSPNPDRPSTPDDNDSIESYLILEDGGIFLMEDGSSFLLESSEVAINDSVLSLENGGLFLLENGSYMLLEQTIETTASSLLLLENGANVLLENGANLLLEKQ